MKKLLMSMALASLACAAGATGVRMKHTVTLKGGWNAFFLPVTPAETASEVFAGWPVERVGFYDQAAFLATRQFTAGADDTTLGAVDAGMKMWVRGDPGHSSFSMLVANGVYVAVNTNKTTFTADLYGEPAAFRMAWHVSDGETRPVNYMGVSCADSASVTADGYLTGLDTGWTARWRIYGTGTATVPGLEDISRSPTMNRGEVVAMDAANVSDWSGALNVSPAAGIVLSTNLSTAVLTVRNDAATNRLVRVGFRPDDGASLSGTPTVMFLDPAVHAAWQPSLLSTPYERELLPGAALALRLAVDRRKEIAGAAGEREYGGILDVTDASADRPSGFKTSVPLSVLSDGGAFLGTQWPKGLWVTTVTLDKVNHWILAEEATNSVPVAVSRPMSLRLLVHVGADGAMSLMQRAHLGGRRLSAAALPAVADAVVTNGVGTFGAEARFDWTVAEHSKANPFRHAKHPDHDGKSADFGGPAPSGDDFDNYLETVKPELFSLANGLSLVWNASAGAAWSPEETLSGACEWSIGGLRHEGPIKMSGTFSMRRVSAADRAELLEDAGN